MTMYQILCHPRGPVLCVAYKVGEMVLLRLLQGRWGGVEVTLVRNIIMRGRTLTTAVRLSVY